MDDRRKRAATGETVALRAGVNRIGEVSVSRRLALAGTAAAIPSSTPIVESGVSHFAMLQNPAQFNADLLKFLGER